MAKPYQVGDLVAMRNPRSSTMAIALLLERHGPYAPGERPEFDVKLFPTRRAIENCSYSEPINGWLDWRLSRTIRRFRTSFFRRLPPEIEQDLAFLRQIENFGESMAPPAAIPIAKIGPAPSYIKGTEIAHRGKTQKSRD